MKMFSNENEDIELRENTKLFLRKMESEMMYSSNYIGGLLSFEWLDEIEYACPFIDNVVRKPKIALVQEELVTKMLEEYAKESIITVRNINEIKL